VDSAIDSDAEAPTEFLDPLVVRARTLVGQVLRGKWRLDVLLGVGGMASVYAATHRNGTRAALKLLHPELSVNAQVRTRFLREGYVANAVGHDGAVKVIDDDTAEDGALFLVTELLDGETLEDRRVRFGGRLSEDEVLAATDQLLDVLTAAHAKGIVHRDLKPENVFLTRTGQVKVLDFGIARLRELSTASTATKSGASMGTPAYMPPEQARGLWDEVDARSDLWAVGATMFHLLSGNLVHDGRTANEMLLSAMTKPAQPLASAASNITPAVTHVVDRALAFEREKRWADAHRMQEAVRHAYHDRFGTPLSTAPRLTVPETVPNRTLASASSSGPVAPKLPTTGQPVLATGGSAPQASRLSRGAVAALVFGGAGTIGIVIAALAFVALVARRGAPAPAAAGQAHRASALLPTTATGAPTPRPSAVPSTQPALPEVSATDLPSATAAAPTPKPAPARPGATAERPTTQAGTATAAGKRNCNPPFTIDPATGKKNWKLECL